MNWSEKDKVEIESHGLDIAKVERQLKRIERGPTALKIARACTVNDGVKKLSHEQADKLVSIYDKAGKNYKVCKFVPASGAATRMFKHLHSFLEGEDSELSEVFFKNLPHFPFIPELEKQFDFPLSAKLSRDQREEVVRFLISERGLNYGSMPKGLIPFHRYENESRTAFEEQLEEGLAHLPTGDSRHFHFTVAPDCESEIKRHLQQKAELMNVRDVVFEFSRQDPATDTIAADSNNQAFRGKDDSLVFRPGGHGALIGNLQSIHADIVFIKNIDNVAHADFLPGIAYWKKVLGGLLIDILEKNHHIIELLQKMEEDAISSAQEFVQNVLGHQVDFAGTEEEQRQQFIDLLDRPLRVCGMVKNEGEPGGGPYWVRSTDGLTRPQIVEKAQIDTEDEKQRSALSSATHFNPVDLVCSLKRADGSAFDLSKFIDSDAFFVSEKSKDGRPLRALEHPGLWNGAMSGWNTVFVEVPLDSFNPVKTVNDLLKPLHQPG